MSVQSPSSTKNRENGTSVSRRDFMRIAGAFGLTNTLLAASAATGVLSAPQLAAAASETAVKRAGKAKYKLKFGASSFDLRQMRILRVGIMDFVRDLEERSDGAISIEIFLSNQICTQLNCITKTQQGIIDIFTSPSQNCAGAAPFYNALDFPYMFPSRASIYHFLYSHKSEKLFREPLRKVHGVHFLFTPAELRGIYLGEKYKDKPMQTVESLKGAKMRTTGSQLGLTAMKLLGFSPVPIAWEETMDALRQGLVDGQEVYAVGLVQGGMAQVTTQALELEFFAGTAHTAMRAQSMEKMEGRYQDCVMESAYWAQTFCQLANESTRISSIGVSEPPLPNTEMGRHHIRVKTYSAAEKKVLEEMCSPKFHPQPYESWSERINKWGGNQEIFKGISEVAREIPADLPADLVEPNRWWRSES